MFRLVLYQVTTLSFACRVGVSVLIPGYFCLFFVYFIFIFIIIITVTLGFACRAGVSVLISGYILGEALVRLVLHCDVTSFLTHGTELKKIYIKTMS